MRGIQPFRYSYTSGNSRAGFSSIIRSYKSLGQAFLKACRCPEGKALGRSSQWSKLLYAVRSEKGEFSPQSGGLWGKEGKPCKRGLPLNAFPIRQLFLLGQYFGPPNGDNWNWNAFLAVKKHEFRFPVQAKDSVLLKPANPLKRVRS